MAVIVRLCPRCGARQIANVGAPLVYCLACQKKLGQKRDVPLEPKREALW